jgi:beta-lactamase regulating signal transducer with metallopeptidase domain
MNAADLHPYGINVLLHMILLSLLALAAASCFRNPHARSMSAALGLLSLSIIPWLSALQVPSRNTVVAIPIAPVRVSKALPLEIATVPEIRTVDLLETTSSPVASSKFETPHPWTLLAGIWMLGCAVQIIRRSVAAIHLSRWKSSLRHATATELQNIREHSPDLPNSCRVQISEAATSPCVAGWFRPTLVLPENLLAMNSQRQLIWALRHEGGHLRGNDLQWFELFQFILAVLWWNPFAHRLVRIWADSREQVCDQLAVIDLQDRSEYGAFIVSLSARRMSGSVLAMADRSPVTRLKRRIRFLMESRVSPPCGRGFIAGGMVVMILIGLGLSQVGVHAETLQEQATKSIENDTEASQTKAVESDTSQQNGPLPTTGAKQTKAADSPQVDPRSLPQIKIASVVLFTSNPIGENNQPLSADDMEKLLLQAGRSKDTEIHRLPSVTCLNQQESNFAMIREHPENPKPAPIQLDDEDQIVPLPMPPLDDPNYRFVGIQTIYQPTIMGKEVNFRCRSSYSQYPGMKWDNLTEALSSDPSKSKEIDWSRVQKRNGDGQARLQVGEWLCTTLGTFETGRVVTLCCQVIPIDRSGQPVADFSVPQEIPKPHPTFPLIAEGWLVDADQYATAFKVKDFPDVPGSLIGIYSKKEAEDMRKSATGKFIELPPAEFQSGGKSLALWKQLPDFRLKVYSGSKGFVSEVYMTFPWKSSAVQTNLTIYRGYYVATTLPAPAQGKRQILFLCVNPAQEASSTPQPPLKQPDK